MITVECPVCGEDANWEECEACTGRGWVWKGEDSSYAYTDDCWECDCHGGFATCRTNRQHHGPAERPESTGEERGEALLRDKPIVRKGWYARPLAEAMDSSQHPPRLIWPINPTDQAIAELGAACSNCGRSHDVSGRITGDRIWCPCGHWLTVDHPARITLEGKEDD